MAETGENVAIKKVFQDKRYKNRELQILQQLNHPHVTTLKSSFYTQGTSVSLQLLPKIKPFLSA